jgi:hypothetical protein
MTPAAFAAALGRASIPGRCDVVRVLAPSTPLPEPDLFRKVLDAWRDPDVKAVVLVKVKAC